MKTEFIQEMANSLMLEKLTTNLTIARKERLSEMEWKDVIRSLRKLDFAGALSKTEQDPVEITKMCLEAFEESIKIIRKRLETNIPEAVRRISQEVKS